MFPAPRTELRCDTAEMPARARSPKLGYALAAAPALPGGLWSAAGLAAIGCFFVVRAYHPGGLDGVGVAEAFGAAATFAVYLFASEQAGHRYEPVTILVWGFGLASVFWLITQPAWSCPLHPLSCGRNLAFALYIVIGRTPVPFSAMLAAARLSPASAV